MSINITYEKSKAKPVLSGCTGFILKKINSIISTKYIVYQNGSDGNKIYRKLYSDTNSGSALNSVISSAPSISPDFNNIIYTNTSDTGKIYIKTSFGTDNGTPINSVSSANPKYSPDGQYIFYQNQSDGNKLYKKTSTGIDNGSAITSSSNTSGFDISPDGQYIVYRNTSDNKLYKKTATGTDDGSAITSGSGIWPKYSTDGQYIVYTNTSDGNKLYKKTSTGTDNGSAITSSSGFTSTFTDDGYIIYRNSSDGNKLYKKTDTGTDNGSAITSISSFFPTFYIESIISPSSNPGNSSLITESLSGLNIKGNYNSGSITVSERIIRVGSASFSSSGGSSVSFSIRSYDSISNSTIINVFWATSPVAVNTKIDLFDLLQYNGQVTSKVSSGIHSLAPTAPSGLIFSGNILNWNPSLGATSYKVKVGAGTFTDIGNVTSYDATAVSGGTTIYVRAYDGTNTSSTSSIVK